jgi:ATP-dependent Clp protease ATP-binding subunit ClpA
MPENEKQNKSKIEDLFFNDSTIPKSQNTNSGGGGNPPPENIKKKAEDLGLTVVPFDTALERNNETIEAMNLIQNNENIMILGNAGVGKTNFVQNLSKELSTKGKTLISIPAEIFSSGIVGSSARAIDAIFGKFTPLELKNIVFFMDEIHSVINMGTFGIGDQDQDTPRNLLKQYLTGTGDKRIVLIGATTTKEYNEKILKIDTAFCRRFQNIELQPFTLEQMKKILSNNITIQYFKKIGLNINSESNEELKKYEQITSYTCELLDKFARYQSFPEKGFKFLKRLFVGKNITEITQQDIENLISLTYQIPLEIITKKITENSIFNSLDKKIEDTILGQDEALKTVSSKILTFIQEDRTTPLTFLAVGTTGVGKTQTAEELANTLNVPTIKFNMGEYKSPYQTESFVKKIKDYIKENYAGIIILDEIEKANPEILDAVLSLTDKGEIGSGQDKVKAPAQIIFMTSNLAVNSLQECEELLKTDGINEIPDKLARAILIEDTELKPEFIGRINSVLHYKMMTPEIAVEISKKYISKKIEAFKKEGTVLSIDDSIMEKIIHNSYSKNGGVRTIKDNIDGFFDSIFGNQVAAIQLKQKTRIGEETETTNIIKIKDENGKTITYLNENKLDIIYNLDSNSINIDDVMTKIRATRLKYLITPNSQTTLTAKG